MPDSQYSFEDPSSEVTIQSSYDPSNYQGPDNLQFDTSSWGSDPNMNTSDPGVTNTAVKGTGSIFDLINSPGAKALLSAGSGAYGLYQANAIQSMAKAAFGQQDPFASYRGQYGAQLSNLESNPGSITSDPGYQFSFDQGSQAVQRGMAKQGYLGSGNEAIALQEYGQGFASSYLQQKEASLAGLAGANITPNAAPALSGMNAGANLAGSALASLGYGATRGGASSGTPGGGFSSAGGEAASLIGNANAGIGVYNNVSKATGGDGVSRAPGSVGGYIGAAGDVMGIYQGVETGGVRGYTQAGIDTYRLAGATGLIGAGTDAAAGASLDAWGSGAVANSAVAESSAAGGTASGGAAAGVGTALGVVGAGFAVYNAVENYQSGKTGSDTLQGAEAGAAVGSIFGPVGTVVGGVIGGVVGAVASAFGPGAKDPEQAVWGQFANSGQKLNANQISPQSVNTALAGLFRFRDNNNFPARQGGYGRFDENKFVQDMTNKIGQGLQAGTIKQGDDASTIFSKVVDPWMQNLGSWKDTNASDLAAQKKLVTDVISQYQAGQQVVYGNTSQWPVTPYSQLAQQVQSGSWKANFSDIYGDTKAGKANSISPFTGTSLSSFGGGNRMNTRLN